MMKTLPKIEKLKKKLSKKKKFINFYKKLFNKMENTRNNQIYINDK